MSGFLQVTQYIEALLRQAPALAPDIERSRDKRVEEATESALRIFPGNAEGQVQAIRGGFHRWGFDVTVDCYARAALEGASAGDVEAAVDALFTAVWQRLAAAEPPAGVATLMSNVRVAWEYFEGARPLGVARVTFAVDLSTHNQTAALRS